MLTNGIQMTNQRFGAFRVMRQCYGSAGNGEAIWVCRCRCGNQFTATGSSIRSGRKKSCGCVKTPKHRDITGMRSGHLVAVEHVGREPRSYNARWRCLCDCGTSVVTTGPRIETQRQKSCGCKT